ncbi:MAG: hypothetical protein OEQ74_03315 [Gammaproteobacteria bacterium]|nr:hypothetical protein [Gammaproteobacteria bacterium]
MGKQTAGRPSGSIFASWKTLVIFLAALAFLGYFYREYQDRNAESEVSITIEEPSE